MPSPWANRLYREHHREQEDTAVNYSSSDPASVDVRAIQREGFAVDYAVARDVGMTHEQAIHDAKVAAAQRAEGEALTRR